jgi:AraC-like DNA-binding protein
MAAAAPIDPLCRILTAWQSDIGPAWTHRLCDPFWRVYLNEQAGAEVVFPGGVHRLLPGRLHLLPAWGDFTARCHERAGIQYYLHLDLADWGRGLFTAPVALPPDPVACAAIRTLCDGTWAWTADGRLRARAFALQALAGAVATLPTEAQDQLVAGISGDDPVAVVRRFVEEHLAEDLDLGRLARACGLSPRHLGDIFHERTGRTPMAYVRERRVANAAELLLSGAVPIEDVAQRVGFVNRHHFSRIFARLVGCGPASYRRTRRPVSDQAAALTPGVAVRPRAGAAPVRAGR